MTVRQRLLFGKLIVTLCSSLLVGLLLVGCSSSPAPAGPWTGPLAQARAVWSAEPGIDLLTRPSVVIRAYVESFFVASARGEIKYAYPGFQQAVDTDSPSAKVGWPWPSTLQPAAHPLVGTYRFHILRVNGTGRQVTAVVCDWAYGAAFDLGDGQYGSGSTAAHSIAMDGIDVAWIAMTAPGGNPAPSLPPQKGPEPAPSADVFGGWRVDGRLVDAPDDPYVRHPEEWPSQLSDAQQCEAKAPDPADRRKFLANGQHPRSDYPTASADPGWP
jgi:hypothetical protein